MEENTSVEKNTSLETAKQEIEAILKKYKVALVPIVIHQGDRTISRIDITPIEESAVSAE